jgi:hypothetical protein
MSLSHVLGKEHCDMCQILLGLIIDLCLPNNMLATHAIHTVCGMLNFLYISQNSSQTAKTLQFM